MAYIIVEGTARVECKKTAKKIQALVYEEDPTKALRDREKSPVNKKTNDSIKNLIKNGYTSDTLRSIQIGILSNNEWIGEDLLIMEVPTGKYREHH